MGITINRDRAGNNRLSSQSEPGIYVTERGSVAVKGESNVTDRGNVARECHNNLVMVTARIVTGKHRYLAHFES